MGTYSFLDVQASIVGPGGTFSLGNGAGVSEEGIDVTMLDEKDTMAIGADGAPMHSLHAGKSGIIAVSLLKISNTNQLLRVMYDLQTSSSSLHGKNVIVVQNIVSGDISTGRQCAFKKLPALKYGKDANYNVWEFNVGYIDGFMGTY